MYWTAPRDKTAGITSAVVQSRPLRHAVMTSISAASADGSGTAAAAAFVVCCRRLQTICKHASDVTKCCFSKRHDVLAVGSSDRTVSVWEWRPGSGFVEKSYSPLSHHKYTVTSVQFDGDATVLATSSLDGNTRLCDVGTGRILHTFVQNSCCGIRSSCFVGNYKCFVSADDDGTMCVWDVFRKVLVRTLTAAHGEAVTMMCCSKDSSIMMTGDTTGVVKVWSVAGLTDACGSQSTPMCVLSGCHDMGVNSADISPVTAITDKGKEYGALTCGNDHLVKVWRLILSKSSANSHRCAVEMVQSLKGHSSTVTSVCFDDSGVLFASTSMDKTTRLWQMVESNKVVCLKVLEGHTRYVNTCGFSRNGLLFATGSNDKSVIIWDVKGELDLNTKLNDSEDQKESLQSVRNAVQVEVSLRKKLNNFTNAVNSCDFSAKHEYIVAAGSDKIIRVWRLDENGHVEECKGSPLRAHHYSVQQVVVSPCSTYMASCSLDGTTIIWNLSTLEQKGSLYTDLGGAKSCSFSGSSELIAVACDNEVVFVWNVNTLQLVSKLDGNGEDVTCVSFSPDTRYLMSGCVEGHFRIWPVHPTKRVVSETSAFVQDNAHEIGITSAHFAFKHPSKKKRSLLMATGGNDAFVKTWRLLDDRIDFKMKFVGHGGDITCVRFPRNTTTFLASTSLDKTARIWQTKNGDCLHVIDPKDAILTCCSFSSNNQLLATGSLDKALFLWNLPLDNDDTTTTIIIRKSASLEKCKTRLNSSTTLDDEDGRELDTALTKLTAGPLQDVPDEFVCPITQQIFRDPVMCADGHTYERSAIVSWFRRGKITSPLTNEPLLSKGMTPNTTVKEAIAVFVRQNQ